MHKEFACAVVCVWSAVEQSRTHNMQSIALAIAIRNLKLLCGTLQVLTRVPYPSAYLEDDCRLLSDVGRRPLRSNSNDMLGVSRPPVLDCGTTFHPDYGGWDLPSTPSDNQSMKAHLFGDRSA